ncbi:hypothetical protein FB451DRAFT_1359086 [Mycena latifolia]|nr:hypothetical protein FB451DRAFT_1359086 [Mycena latifolia]
MTIIVACQMPWACSSPRGATKHSRGAILGDDEDIPVDAKIFLANWEQIVAVVEDALKPDFTHLLEKDQATHGVEDYELDNENVDEFQESVDNVIDAGSIGVATPNRYWNNKVVWAAGGDYMANRWRCNEYYLGPLTWPPHLVGHLGARRLGINNFHNVQTEKDLRRSHAGHLRGTRQRHAISLESYIGLVTIKYFILRGHYLKPPNFGLANSWIFWRSCEHLGMDLGIQVFLDLQNTRSSHDPNFGVPHRSEADFLTFRMPHICTKTM